MFHKRLWVLEHLFYAFVCIDFLNSIEFLIVCLLIWFQPLFLCESCVLADLQGNWLWCLISSYLIPVIIDFVYLGKIKWFADLPQLPFRKVCYFRAWRKLFPEWFDVSALGESCFPNGLAFPRLAKVISRKVWYFRAWRKSFPEWFGAFAIHLESFLKCISLYEWATWLKTQWMERQAFYIHWLHVRIRWFCFLMLTIPISPINHLSFQMCSTCNAAGVILFFAQGRQGKSVCLGRFLGQEVIWN